MKPGSLVVYIGGQTAADIADGFGLSKDTIYVVDKVGFGYMGVPARKKRAISLVERPNEVHSICMFREVQPPDAIDFEELLQGLFDIGKEHSRDDSWTRKGNPILK